jgi:hypothetical protein
VRIGSSHDRIFAIALLVALAGCSLSELERPGAVADKVITPELVKQHIFFLASDSLMGRNTPSPGLDTAAHYIARVFHSSGLQPISGSYFEKVALGKVGLGQINYLNITRDGVERSYTIKTEFTPFEMTANKEVSAPIVFAGYGITAPEYKYDDYEGMDVGGKVVFVLRHEPGEEDSTSAFDGKSATKYSSVASKVKIAVEHGAVGVLVATDPLNHTSLTPRGFPWPSLTRTIPRDALPLMLLADEKEKVPVLHVGHEAIAQLFGSVETLRSLQLKIDSSMRPHSFEIGGAAVASMKTTTTIRDMSTQNVVGYLEGSDPKLKNEVLVVGAHYDHVGYKKKHQAGEDYIYNGADDNASGTTAVLAIAEAFGRLPQKPKRSILFMTFAGEEEGGLGSRTYTENPFFPLEQTVAMINLDMVGRNSEDTLIMVGSSRCPELAQINREENRGIGFVLVSDDKVIGGSDHALFFRKNIPFLFYFAGFHPQYHQVTDNPELINTAKLSKVARLAFRTAWRIANDDQRYHVIKNP